MSDYPRQDARKLLGSSSWEANYYSELIILSCGWRSKSLSLFPQWLILSHGPIFATFELVTILLLLEICLWPSKVEILTTGIFVFGKRQRFDGVSTPFENFASLYS